MHILTIVSAVVEDDRADDLILAYEELLAQGFPDGLLESRLLRSGEGTWAIHSLWRDLAALEAMRASGEPPAALALFKRFGAEPTLAIMRVAAASA